MSRTEFSKLQASLSIEELIAQPEPHQQQWLLTYLDVFVLILMLVITLLAISDFEKEQQTIAQPNIQLNSKAEPKIKQLLKDATKPNPENTGTQKIVPKKTAVEQIEKNDAEKKAEQHLVFNENIVNTENDKVDKQLKLPPDYQPSDKSLQQQLEKTVEQLGLIDAVQMKVTLGYAQLEIQDKILFKSSNANLLTQGGTVLNKLVPLLEQSSGLIYVEGHTDNRPIKTDKFPTNWELGAARATSVLHYLSSQKIPAARLRAVTFGDTKPIADNSTEQGREKNRRVSLVIKVSDKID